MSNNGYFHVDDPTVKITGGMDLLPSWWSRPYEYAWAMGYIVPGQVVADMGCGYSPRPFKEELADRGCDVYAIDGDPRVLELPSHKGVRLIHRNFLDPMDDLPMFDRIFCISVLEDLTDDLPAVLKKFASKLKPDGLLVVTFDTPYHLGMPTPKYPGLEVLQFLKAAKGAGFYFEDFEDGSYVHGAEKFENLVHHDEWNLAVTHWVLKHENA